MLVQDSELLRAAAHQEVVGGLELEVRVCFCRRGPSIRRVNTLEAGASVDRCSCVCVLALTL